MTYGIGMKINNGLLFMSDTRTNAGVDNISTFKKMFAWTNEGHSVVTILAAGNLATTQSLISIFQGNGDSEQNLETTILLAFRMSFSMRTFLTYICPFLFHDDAFACF